MKPQNRKRLTRRSGGGTAARAPAVGRYPSSTTKTRWMWAAARTRTTSRERGGAHGRGGAVCANAIANAVRSSSPPRGAVCANAIANGARTCEQTACGLEAVAGVHHDETVARLVGVRDLARGTAAISSSHNRGVGKETNKYKIQNSKYTCDTGQTRNKLLEQWVHRTDHASEHSAIVVTCARIHERASTEANTVQQK